MENPGEMLRRARQNKRKPAVKPVRETAVPEKEHSVRIPHSGHSGYSALMRSHDRMGTRHIGGKG